MDAGLTGSLLFWENNAISTTFYQNQFPFGGACFKSMTEAPIDGTGSSTKREIGSLDAVHQSQELPFSDSAYQGTPLAFEKDSLHTVHHIAPSILKSSAPLVEEPTSGIMKRDAVPFLPGNLFCPEAGDDITSSLNGTDCTFYDDDEANDPFGTGVLSRRAVFDDEDTLSIPFRELASDSTLRTCSNITIPIPSYQNTPIIAYYDLANPATLDPTFGPWTHAVPVNLGANPTGRPYMVIEGNKVVYAREHPYEVSMGKYFFFPPVSRSYKLTGSSSSLAIC